MSKSGSESDDEDEVPIVVDIYGVKAKGRPGDLGEQSPSSWRDVARQVNRHLMRIVTGSTRLVAEVLEGATRLARGLSSIPNSINNKIRRTHAEADAKEQELQEIAESKPTDTSTKADVECSLSQIQAILQKYASQGLDAYITLGPNGRIIIALGTPPGSEAQVLKAAEQAQKLLEGSSEHSQQEETTIALDVPSGGES